METFNNLKWTRAPKIYDITDERIQITTEPNTDLWQRTYYGFRNDNAPVLQMTMTETYFSFTVRTDFNTKRRFDQCGVVIYLDSDNWLKASIEYEDDTFQRLGSVVTNNGYSDWSSFDITSDITSMWYRLSRRESDYCIEYSEDGKDFKQMRICHLNEGQGEIQFGIYACSPEASSFVAEFTHMNVGPCQWEPHV
ncbi:DUF1349 domain-containing protein [Macrococcus epidermidis]|uniref:DUF1349 domain-containing protein n=1 Tax=Macrococcus epidermidis TaxID=1902580 RepID=A0A327ZR06_9STAP|nr:DUF1349 domain-containing protein [Macrococcus epidermidis]RAK44649.1 DUF1349 domain-containing protein [Macrococcus epidermidis]